MLHPRSHPRAMRKILLGFLNILCARHASALADTDTVTWGGDNSRAGYQTTHNLDPNVVAGPDFGQIFATKLPGNFNGLAAEQVFAAPLVYTGGDGIQYVYIATTQNNLYKLDAKTGIIIASRNLHVPFLQAELESCVDINPVIGITATGVIDPDTGIWYVTSKTYSQQFQNGNFGPNNPPGRLNGRIWQHGVHTEDLSEADGWPVLVDGTVFRNNPNRMFVGGNQHSRPGALLVGDYVYTGYASHCVQYNFTGAIIGFHKKTGKIIEAFATQGGPEPNTVKGGGVWMGGGGLAYDGKGSMYFATGNGYASQLKATGNSVPGRSPPSSLEEAAVNAKINDDGTLTVIDFFMPWEKTQLDGADKDLGTTPLVLLPSDVFTCPNHRRIGVVTGKSGKTYWLDLDNLGGYQMGANKLDAVIQVFQNENSVYAGAGVLPLSGGYIYISVTQYPTHVFKFTCNSNGNAVFTKVADTPDKNAYILGTGHGTTTSLYGQEGTGLLWTSDVQGGSLRIYDPIPPQGGGPLNLLKTFNMYGVTKFIRPVFGDGRVYIGSTSGVVYGFGSPVNLPLNCSSPYSFGSVALGNVSTPLTITCTALVSTTIIGIGLTPDNFNISNVPTTPLSLAVGKTFSFIATSNPRTVGPLSSDIIVNTTNSQSGYATRIPITLKAVGHSVNPILALAPNTISFNSIAGEPTELQNSLFWNLGDTGLVFSNISFSLVSEQGPWVAPNKTANGTLAIGNFIFVDVPTAIPAGGSAPISVIYNPDAPGTHAVYVKAFSTGGNAVLDVFGVAGTPPKMVIAFQSLDGTTWVPYTPGTPFTFGTVYQSQTRNLLFRITNGGGPNAVPLSITISKPPYGIPGIIGKANNIDLAEGTSLAAGESETAAMYCSVPKAQVNTPSYNGTAVWVLNSGDLNTGKQEVGFFCQAAAEQIGPVLPNGTYQFGYVGCFQENAPGRQLATNIYSDTVNNTNDRCINACYSAGWIFAGTQYSQECWCGNAIPIQLDLDRDCNFGCTGNKNQTCGGDGYLHNQAHISLFADRTKFDGNTTSPALQIPLSVGLYNFIGCYAEPGGKTFSDKITSNNIMTVPVCATFCVGYTYFGLEFGGECYCGAKLNVQSTVTNSAQCNMPCKGSNSQYCGASSRMQVYQLNGIPPSVTSSTVSSTAATPTSTLSPLVGWVSQGCYNESVNGRALVDKGQQGQNALTLESCAAFCAGYAFFGVEYASECYCGNVLSNTSILQPIQTVCNMRCSGNQTQLCGGPNLLNLYVYKPTTVSSSLILTTTSISSPTLTLVTNSSSSTSATASSNTLFSLSSASVTANTSQSSTTASSIASNSISTSSLTTLTSTSSSTSSAPTSTPTSPICPASNSSTFTTSGGGIYRIDCFVDRAGNDIGLVYVSTFAQCLSQCDANAKCDVVSWIGNTVGVNTPCYMKSAIGLAVTDSRIWGAVQVNSASVSSSSSTMKTGPTSSLGSAVSVSGGLTSSLSTSTSSSASVSQTSSTVSLSTSSTSRPATTSSTSSLGSSGSTSLSSSASSSLPSSTSLTLSSTVSTSSSSMSSSSSSTTSWPAAPSGMSPSCPSANSTVYTSPAGAKYLIECYIDHPGYDILSVATYVRDFESCMWLCDVLPNCVDVSFSLASNGACYPKSAILYTVQNKNVLGARLLSFISTISTTTATSSSSTSTASSSTTVSSSQLAMSTSSSSSTTSSVSTAISSTSSSTSVSSSTSTTVGSSSSVSTLSSSSASRSTSVSSSTSIAASQSTTSSSFSTLLSSSTSSVQATISSTLKPSTSTSTTSSASSSSTTSSSQTSTATSTSPSTTTTTTTTRLPPPTPSPIGTYTYLGCYTDPAPLGLGQARALSALPVLTNSTSMTPLLCSTYCAPYAYFGVEYARECWCGPYLSRNSSLITTTTNTSSSSFPSSSDCTTPCTGDPLQICGGPARLSVYYSNSSSKISTDPVIAGNGTMGRYVYSGCYVDTAKPRILGDVVASDDGMDTGRCVAFAEKGGWAYAGLEFGRECWVGNVLAVVGVTEGNRKTDEGECRSVCVGSRGEWCGGVGRIGIWSRV